jgi:NADPH2:quinone reductase
MQKLRAVIGDELGPPESFRLFDDCDPGEPGPGEVRYRIHAVSVTFVDALLAAGKYQIRPPVPFVPGGEVAGVVERVGAGVTAFAPGDRVCGIGMGNGFRDVAIAPADTLRRYPETLDFAEAATFVSSLATAYHALVQRAQVQPGETVLVLGAGGAVGCASIQLAKIFGARAIASASTQAKRELALRMGADAAVDARSASWRDDVKAANGGRPVDVVVDTIGGGASEPAFRSLAWKGRHLVIGFAGGGIPKLPLNLALLKGAALLGVDLRQFSLYEPETAEANIAALFELHRQRGLKPYIGHRFPLEQFADALRLAESGQAVGRIVVEMD